MSKIRTVFYYKNYFYDFYKQQSDKVRKKINWTLGLIETIDRVPELYLKHLAGTQGLYEIRVEHRNDIYRIFCFFR